MTTSRLFAPGAAVLVQTRQYGPSGWGVSQQRSTNSRCSPCQHFGDLGRACARRSTPKVLAVGWDPEGILSAPQPGHITRRQMQKQLKQADQEAQILQAEQQRELQRRMESRQTREVPESDAGLLEFLLKVEAEDGPQELEFEVARCGPRFTEGFFSALRTAMGSIRFAQRQSKEDLERLGQLERLEKLLQEQVGKQEAFRSAVTGAKERLHALLSAKDKKEKILAMAAAGELDFSLLALLDENISAAQQAEQGPAVEFMEKIRGAVVKYMTKEQTSAP